MISFRTLLVLVLVNLGLFLGSAYSGIILKNLSSFNVEIKIPDITEIKQEKLKDVAITFDRIGAIITLKPQAATLIPQCKYFCLTFYSLKFLGQDYKTVVNYSNLQDKESFSLYLGEVYKEDKRYLKLDLFGEESFLDSCKRSL